MDPEAEVRPWIVARIDIGVVRCLCPEWAAICRPGPDGFQPSDLELRECPLPECGDGEAWAKGGQLLSWRIADSLCSRSLCTVLQVLLATHLMSMDPTMRNAMAGGEAAGRTEGSAYYKMMNWEPGSVITWRIAGLVLESKVDGFSKGEIVFAQAPWREINAVNAGALQKMPEGVSPSAAFSCLALTAVTGYLGVKHVMRPNPGDVAYVSGAAGATGLIACHTLKQMGCRVIGSAGSAEKVKYLESLGFEAFNYHEEKVLNALKRLAPAGLNACFDNVGGETLEAVLEMMNDTGSVTLCGAISQYDTKPEQRYGVRNLFQVVAKRLRIEGFIQGFFPREVHAEAAETLSSWLRAGKISDCSSFVDGFENLPDGILGLFSGRNTGKMLVRVPLELCKF